MSKTKTKTQPKLKTVAPKTKSRTPAKGTPIVIATERSAKVAVPKPAAAGPTLRALRSAIYTVGDLAQAKAFYSALLGKAPYFDEPFYVGFEIDGAELGLDPDTKNRKPGPGGAVAYWRVDDISASWEFSIAFACARSTRMPSVRMPRSTSHD